MFFCIPYVLIIEGAERHGTHMDIGQRINLKCRMIRQYPSDRFYS